jgi:DNA-binding transcriptional LysR family regulator
VPVEIRQLRYFVTVAHELNCTRAARRLNVVQQTLSAATTQLETMLATASS